MINKSCEGCKGKQPQGVSPKIITSNKESDIPLILNKIETLTNSINEKTINQIVIVHARPGLGYDSENDSSACSSAHEKLTRELTEKG